MAPTVLSTAPIPAKERLDYWYEVISQTYDQLASVQLDISTPTDAPYGGTITADLLGSVPVAMTEAAPLRVRQTVRVVGGPGSDYLNVLLQESGLLVIDQKRGQTLLRPGALTLFDTTGPYTVTYPAPFRMHVFQIPRSMLGVREADLRRITAVPLDADTETAALVIQFLSRLVTRAGSHPPHIGDLLARNAADLLATLIAERLDRDVPDTGTDAAGTALRLRVRAFIDRRLTDRDLSPQTIADAHRISVRYLHRLFQHEGTTVSRWILSRRLEVARRELSRPLRSGPSVTAVAHRWGFTSTSHFSRAFRAAYGMSPREWRNTADQSEHNSPM
ncbi:helix-turn-helix domain-containing protein [Streptomyces sp. CA-250714]|uniref:helix-turn-helix domain-containing protein n=1 Tax=Streptomyces sp. CA-250714 TaxID=3240060 RepID=UPI003D8BA533